jgi:pimeloyl-ACP methyl ester carboxylesterase
MVAIITGEVTAPVEGMHRAIVERWMGFAGPRVDPMRRLADGVTASIYRTVRLGGSVAASTTSMASEVASDRVSLPPVWETAKGRYVQSIFNGVWGDKLEADESPLRIELGLRSRSGFIVSANQTSLSQAFPNPTGRLVVMIHGFGETERCWHSNNSRTLLEGLEADGFTVLGLRYNTGRTVTDNGSDLADLLEAVRAAWPVPVDELALIGHSMGGLVARSAVLDGRSAGHRWVDLATHLVAIGTPHLGSPIEKGIHLMSQGLGLFNETRPLATFLESRSAGIKDLRHGADHQLENVQYHMVAGAVTTEPTHPFGVLVGDLVVRVSSAIGRGRRRQVPSSSVLVLGGRNHADLLHDPEVVSHVRGWLSPSL